MVVSESESDRDSWVRLTLRLPPELHAQIEAVSRAGAMSLNAAIVQLLQGALNMQHIASHANSTLDEVQKIREELDEKIAAMSQGKDRSEQIIKSMVDALVANVGEIVRSSVREEIGKALEQGNRRASKR